ncbi:phosphotransferase [Paenibacillus sp. WQ 127069]|uniref:Phosphotransferase n=1 Tax=Paenibacillus baimaensis TaxID=2982185 RepID=A0ABT2UKN4_9BACL|nr:phosphotransferase [Paenibacillus sp. WQ 127069]MCU6795173.1 phosphotransferase [Paenibacillus sp. WQ 127069]
MINSQVSNMDAIVQQYFNNGVWTVETGESGVNNTTRFILYRNRKYVLRIYENHADLDKVRYEHAVLQALQQSKLSYRIPSPIVALSGDTYVRTQANQLAVLFEYIEGSRADLSEVVHVQSIGCAMGELVGEMAQLVVPLEAAYERYYELYEIHPLVNRERLNAWLRDMESGEASVEAEQLSKEIQRIEQAIPVWSRLPVQLVHSDLVAGNVLADDDGVTGILDFEFVTMDLRVMDAAVFLNEIIRYQGDRWELIEAFIKGYGQSGSLNADEIAALPQLILLRSVVLCIHFLGRHWAGIDPRDEPQTYLIGFAKVQEWLELYKHRLMECWILYGSGEYADEEII